MKKIKTLSIGLLMISATTLLNSCAKNGCTDSNADNYTEDAKKDDGTCTYTGNLVIWWGKALADSANAYGITAIKVYVDGTFVNTYSTSTYWTGAPSCGANGAVNYIKDLAKNKSASVSVLLKDQNGDALGKAESQTLQGGQCLALEIPW